MTNTTDLGDFSMNRLIMFVPFPGLLMRPKAIDSAPPHGKAIKDERDCKLQASANCCPLDFSPSPLQARMTTSRKITRWFPFATFTEKGSKCVENFRKTIIIEAWPCKEREK